VKPRLARGVTLIELIIFIVVVSVGLAGSLGVFNLATQKSADPMLRKQALVAAEAMLEEILLKRYADPDNECTPATSPSCAANSTTDRRHYNDVADYAGWNQTGIRGTDGSVVPGLEDYVTTVAVSDTTPLNGVAAKRVEVTVSGRGESITLVGYRTGYE